MPGAGALEVGAASEEIEKWNLEFRLVRAFDMDGGHTSTQGVEASGETVLVPLYRHRVHLELLRLQFTARRRLNKDWTGWLRLPYDIKERAAAIELIEGATDEQVAQMERSMQIHHPTATLSGFGDANALAAHRSVGIFTDGDVLTLAAGTTIPLGRTEHDPFELGDEGLEHEHVQFGSGTFDPILEAYYMRPLTGGLKFSAFATGRLPVYENDKEYSPPLQFNAGGLLNWQARERLQIHVGLGAFRQQGAQWDGVLDRDSGYESIELLAGANWALGASSNLTLGLVIPLSQRTLVEAAERFERGPALTFGFSGGIGMRGDR
ncbi:MAG TPA: hypothetical protein QF764_12550 [Planctomycetota bacterium]|nr:hypothetical protein [Planctomycetota bacterium]